MNLFHPSRPAFSRQPAPCPPLLPSSRPPPLPGYCHTQTQGWFQEGQGAVLETVEWGLRLMMMFLKIMHIITLLNILLIWLRLLVIPSVGQGSSKSNLRF